MYKVITIGEALIDFIPNKKGCMLKDVIGFERVAWGSPANVAASVAKLSGNAYFISQLGEDAFGDHIIDVLRDANVNTDYIMRTNKANTGLAFVSLKEDGNRDFSFYRNPSADLLLEDNMLEENWFENCGILHFCSVDLVESPMKYTQKKAIEYASKNKSIISFDPNVRLPLWKHENDALKSLFKGNVKVVIYTKGEDGAIFITKNKEFIESKGLRVNAVDTTGAGDSFIGSFLYQLSQKNITIEDLDNLDYNLVKEMLDFSNRYAADTTTKKGAIAAMCTIDEIK